MDFHNQYRIKEWTTEAAAQGLQTAEGCLEQICQATYAKYDITEEITVPQAHRPTLHIDKVSYLFLLKTRTPGLFSPCPFLLFVIIIDTREKNRATEAFMRN